MEIINLKINTLMRLQSLSLLPVKQSKVSVVLIRSEDFFLLYLSLGRFAWLWSNPR